jgi:hypothetical protein
MNTKDKYMVSLASELKELNASPAEMVSLTNWNLLSFILNFLIAV